MRIAAAFLLIGALILPASASERILEPKPLPTTEQLTIATLSAGDGGRSCRQVRMRNSLMDMFPAFLIDADGTKKVFEYRVSLLFGNTIRASKLLPENHPSKCKVMSFVADMDTGKLDVGAYEECEGDVGLRLSDAFYFDRDKKKRMGTEHKLKWDIQFRRLMWHTRAIASMCPASTKLSAN